jgi:hypothetical protein
VPLLRRTLRLRLPTHEELLTILKLDALGCGVGVLPCIDPIFGPTEPGVYWTDTIYEVMLTDSFHEYVDFGVGSDGHHGGAYSPLHESTESHFVRAVRGGS